MRRKAQERIESWPSCVYVIDDDPSVRRALVRLIRSVGVRAIALSSAIELSELDTIETDACVVTDIRMPEASGFEVPERLAQRNTDLPVIFVTALEDDDTRAEARRLGAQILYKPINDQELFDAISAITR